MPSSATNRTRYFSPSVFSVCSVASLRNRLATEPSLTRRKKNRGRLFRERPRFLNPTSRRLRRWSRCEKNGGQAVLSTAGRGPRFTLFGLAPPTESKARGLARNSMVTDCKLHRPDEPAGVAEFSIFFCRTRRLALQPGINILPRECLGRSPTAKSLPPHSVPQRIRTATCCSLASSIPTTARRQEIARRQRSPERRAESRNALERTESRV
jgi:hypothetical protein